MAARLLIDLSNNNAVVSPAVLARQGLDGVWLKVSEGQDFHDRTFAERAAALRSHRVRVGGYHFAKPSINNPRLEARFFGTLLGRVERRDLRPVLDLETNEHGLSSTELLLWAHTWSIECKAVTGVGPLVYTNPGFVLPMRWQKTIGYGLWIASYGPDDGADHGVEPPPPWRHAVAHQYTSRGSIPGVAGLVDLTSAPRLRPLLAHPLLGIV